MRALVTLSTTKVMTLLLGLLMVTMTVSACNTKDTAVTALTVLGDTAIAAQQAGNISDHDAFLVVKYVDQLLKLIVQAPSGWQATVKAGWATADSDIPAAFKVEYRIAYDAVSAAIGAL